MVSCYLLCWMPYGVVALLASFGRPGVVPPAASLIPSLLAKTSTVLNPVVYVLLNNQVTTTTTTHPRTIRGGRAWVSLQPPVARQAARWNCLIMILLPLLLYLCVPQFSRCFLYMIRCSSEAPPTPVHHRLPSSRGVWLHTHNLATQEQRTVAAQQPSLVLEAQYAT